MRISGRDFVEEFEKLGAAGMARKFGMSVRAIYGRRARIEDKIGRQLTGPDKEKATRHNVAHAARHHLTIHDGVVLIGSDAHYWPGIVSTAHRAFVHLAQKLKPEAVILNGDVFDGATASRHPPIGWEDRPKLVDEIIACQTRLREICKAAPKAKKVWTLGNHDGRFETRIATVAPEFAKVHGVHLKDHFGDDWVNCWSCFINDEVVVKHRLKSGIHAPHNNTMWAGRSIVTGHLHSLKVMPISDYNGTRYGIDCGTLAVPNGPQFNDYLEDGPTNWRSGFIVLTFKGGRLLWPEVVFVSDEKAGVVEFRGESFRV